MEIIDLIQRSVRRMAGLIDDVLEFARGRLGAGLAIARAENGDIGQMLKQVVAELQTASPKRIIQHQIEISRPIACDSTRIAQLLSNLLANALVHGDPGSPVIVCARSSADAFELSVANRGKTIPPEIAERLFEPFVRGAVKPGQQGLGLGLYIASEIARAHSGKLSLTSKDGETTFTFRMPLD